MRVRCRATADYRSNAVGDVELEPTPAGLRVTLRGVSSYREGYAPGPPIENTEVCVPWSGVYATLLGERELLLSVDARRLPLNRFRLGELTPVVVEDPARRARSVRLRWLWGAALALASSAALAPGALPYPGAVRTALCAVLVVAAVGVWLRRPPRPTAESVLRELSGELATHLSHHLPHEPARPEPRTSPLSALASRLPRSVFAVIVSLAATSLAAIVGSGAARPQPKVDSAPEPSQLPSALAPPAVEGARSAGAPGAAPPEPASATASPSAPRLGGACRCAHDESWLWPAPPARLSPVIIASEPRVHEGRRHLQIELALVNDGAEPVSEAMLAVSFFEERGGGADQRLTAERTVRLDEPLQPGSAARWHLEAIGTSADVLGPDLPSLAADGSDAAPRDAFAALASRPERALRLHAARLLAFLGDPRARDAALGLQPGATPAEGAVLDRLLDRAPAIAVCELSVVRERSGVWRARACLANHSEQPRALGRARLLAYAEPFDPQRPSERLPRVLGEHASALGAELGPGAGRVFELVAPLLLGEPRAPRAFELVMEEQPK